MNDLIQKTEEFVKTRLAKEGTGHDWWHIERVRANGRAIQAHEGGDMIIIDLALLLHDVGDRKVIDADEDDYTIAQTFLEENNAPEETIQRVMYIIQNMSFSKSVGKDQSNESIEFYTVQDADRLDAMGAIGIARAFAYGGKKERLLYDPTKQIQEVTSIEEYRKLESSTLHHFHEKLFQLKNGMKTSTGKKMAEERDVFMHTFYNRFLDEWNGEK